MLLARPVPNGLEGLLEVGKQQRLLAARGQAAASGYGPFVGGRPVEVFRIAGQQDEVTQGLAVVVQQEAGVLLACLQFDAGGRQVDRGGARLFEGGDHPRELGLRGLDVVDGDAHGVPRELKD